MMPADTAAKRIAIVFNPAAGRRAARGVQSLVAALGAVGIDPELLATRAPGDGAARAREAARRQTPPDIVIAAGGDGTANEVINGLCDGGDTPPPMAVFSLGTVNLLANELGVPRRAGDFVKLLGDGTARTVELGRIDHDGGGRLFVMTAGIGFDARSVDRVSSRIKSVIGRAAYALSAAKVLWDGALPAYQVTVDGVPAPARSLLVANGRFYAGRMVWAPAASLYKPELQVGLFTRGARRHILLCGLGLPFGALGRMPGVIVRAAKTIRVDGPAGEPVQADGDIVARLPVTIRVADQRINVIAPSG